MKESNAFAPLLYALSSAIAGILNIHSVDYGGSVAFYCGLLVSILRFNSPLPYWLLGCYIIFFDYFLENNKYSCIFAPNNDYK